jgi:hypothetical protein
MLSLERCREILGPDCRLSDDELLRLIEEVDVLAEGLLALSDDERRRRRTRRRPTNGRVN